MTATRMLTRVPQGAQQLSYQTVDLDPDLAAKWLTRNSHNRRVRHRKVDQYARDMAAGRWQFNADPIRFDTDGVMLDGQHRCQAVVASGVTVRVLAVFNLAPEAQDTMDIGAARQLSDQLALSGRRNGSMLAAILRKLVIYEAGFRTLTGSQNPTHAEMRTYLEAHPVTVEQAVEVAGKARKYLPCSPSVVGMAYHVCADIDRGAANRFYLTQLIDGIGLGPGDPARALGKRLNDLGAMRGRTNDDDVLRLIFLAWNAARDGRQLTRLQIPKGGWTQANFPTPH